LLSAGTEEALAVISGSRENNTVQK